MFFRKSKRPLYDKILDKKIEALNAIIPPEPEDPDLLGYSWALLSMLATKDTIRSSPLGNKHVSDVFVFESCLAATYFIRQAYISATEEVTPFISDQYIKAQTFLSGYSNETCGWNTTDVAKSRIEHYQTSHDPMGSLTFFLNACEKARIPQVEYAAPASIFLPGIEVMGHTTALAYMCGTYGEILLKIVDQNGFDPDRY